MRPRLFGIAALVIAAAALVTSGCSDSEPDERVQAELDMNRQRWVAEGPSDYDLTERRLCFCPPELLEPVIVRVRFGSVASVTFAETGEPVDPEFARFYLDVEGLFDLIQDAIERDVASLTVEYDAELGFPVEISIDYDEAIVDEELTFRVDGLLPTR